MIHIDENYFKNAESSADEITKDIEQSQQIDFSSYPWEIRLSFGFSINLSDGFDKMRLAQFNRLFRQVVSQISSNDILVPDSVKLVSEIDKERDSQENFTELYKNGYDVVDYIQKRLSDWYEGEAVREYFFVFELTVKVDTDSMTFNMWRNGIIKILKVLYKTAKAFEGVTRRCRNYILRFLLCNVDDYRPDNSVWYQGTVTSWDPSNVIMQTYCLIFGRPKTFNLLHIDTKLKPQRAKMVAIKAYQYVYNRVQQDDDSNYDISLYGYEYDPMKLYFDVATKDGDCIDVGDISEYFMNEYINKFSISSIMNITQNFDRTDAIYIFIRNINDGTVENFDNLSNTRELDEYSCHIEKKTFTYGEFTSTIVIYIYFCNNKWAYKSTNHTIKKEADYAQSILYQDEKSGIV